MKYAYLLFFLLFFGCSLAERRKNHFDYLEVGLTKDEVIKKSGQPIKKNMTQTHQVYKYGYCDTGIAKDLILGVLTYGIYSSSCKGSFVEIDVHFDKNNRIVQVDWDSNSEERDRHNKEVSEKASRAAKGFSEGMQKSKENSRSISCTSNKLGDTTHTNCR